MTEKLHEDTLAAEKMEDPLETAKFYHETILPAMDEIRKVADEAETILPDELLPYPAYEQLLFSV